MCSEKETRKPSVETSSKRVAGKEKKADNNGKGKPGQDDYFYDYSDEPHASRRKKILAKYPQVKELYGYDPNFKYSVTLVIAIQVAIAHYIRYANGWVLFATAYLIGGTCNHILAFALHELSHNLGFKHMDHNRYFAIIANLPIVFPSAITFRRYHKDHHKYQGEDGVDVVVPTDWEARVFRGRFLKLCHVILQGIFYGVRPIFINKKKWGRWEYANAGCCLAFNSLIVWFWGWWSLLYLIASSLLGTGLHPMAAHFIAEHYIFVEGAETYSYYGPLNALTFNVGYHNEHHDFPYIPGSRLPELRRIASEFYDDLPKHDSYCMVLYNFIMDPNMSLYSRIKRQRLSGKAKVEIQQR